MAITITYDGQEYLLTFTRATAQEAEQAGFNLNEIGSKPATMIPLLFYHAFRACHRGVRRRDADRIYQALRDKEGLLTALVELYAETVGTLMEEPDDEGGATWVSA